MRSTHTSREDIGRRLTAAASAAAASAIAIAVCLQPGPPASALAAGPLEGTGVVSGTVRVANVTYGSFSVSWLSADAVTGAVRYGLAPNALTELAEDDLAGSRRTHHASPGWTSGQLAENSRYYYDILTGNGVDNNGGVHYIQNTGPALGIPGCGESVWGKVVTAGVSTSGSLSYATLLDADASGSAGGSAPLSIIADSSAYWSFCLDSFRESDLGAQFGYITSSDLLRLDVQGDPEGQATDTFTVSQAIYPPLTRTVTLTAGILPPPPDPAPLPGPSGPDLVVDSLQATLGSPMAGCSASFSVTVRNTGDVSATAPYRVALYLDHSRVPYAGERSNTNTFWVIGSDLAPAATVELSSLTPFTASGVISRLLAAGNHTLYAQADSYSNQVAELNESNNLYGPITVTAQGACTKSIYLPLVLRSN